METEEKVSTVIHRHEKNGKYINIDDVNVFYLDQGSGPVVFCIHGVPTSSFIYRKVADDLKAKNVRTIAIDLPGLGFSQRPGAFDYTFSNFATICDKLLDKLQIKDFHLVIHDIGAPVGLALAYHRSRAIKSITVLNSMLDIKNFTKPLPMRPFENPALGELELATLTRATWPSFMKAVGVKSVDNIPKEEFAAYIDLLKREDKGKAFLKIMRNFEQTEELSKKCYSAIRNDRYPVQLIWGEKDPFLSWEKHGKPFVEARTDAEVYKLPSKHFVMEEFPEVIAEKIKERTSANNGL